MGLSYRDAGVNIDTGHELVRRIGPLVEATRRPGVLGDFGGFGALFGLRDAGFVDPVLVSGTDGVGTKLKLAFETGVHDTVGIDLVAMCVNDILTTGAEPLFFLDYIGTGRLEPDIAEALIRGVSEGCRLAGCALLGGETAELPGMYAEGEYDLAGFAVGAVERGRLAGPERVRAGDALVALAASGLHSNGYSLARRALIEVRGLALDETPATLGRPLGEALLEPTRIYVPAVQAALGRHHDAIHAMAHITGGGLVENLPRSIPAGLAPRVDYSAWTEPPIFALIRQAGVEEAEMRRTFNLGVGFVLVVSTAGLDPLLATLREAGEAPALIGHVITADDRAGRGP